MTESDSHISPEVREALKDFVPEIRKRVLEVADYKPRVRDPLTGTPADGLTTAPKLRRPNGR